MRESGRVSCLDMTGRASNDELRAWLNADARSDSRSFQLLFQTTVPLLFAFFEGQLRRREADLEVLVLETLAEVYRRRASYDHAEPFRAWLLGIARLKMADCLRAGTAGAAPHAGGEPVPEAERETMRLLRSLARRQVNDVRHAQATRRAVAEAGGQRMAL